MRTFITATAIFLSMMSSVWASPTPINNGSSCAHQQMADHHERMMKITSSVKTGSSSKPFSRMNVHEQAAIFHSFTKNGQSGPHLRAAEKQLEMVPKSSD
ncbi:TPA: hypothetical protein ACIBSF_004290 [Salmonella enterica subsp. enterica serovar Chailey]